MTTRTPKPWVVELEEGIPGVPSCFKVLGNQEPGFSSQLVAKTGDAGQESFYNAHLLAAAPDLLESAQCDAIFSSHTTEECYAQLKGYGYTGPCAYTEIGAWVDVKRGEAISKATRRVS